MKHCWIIIFVVTFLLKENVVDAADIMSDGSVCYSGEAHDYMSMKTTTVTGLECQRWDKQIPHEHEYTDDQFLDGSKSEAKNYCRDPGKDGFLWCYTMDPDVRWEGCGIQWCDEPARNSNPQDCYIITVQDRDSGMSDKEICERDNKTRVCTGSMDVPPGCEDCDGCCQTKDCSPQYTRTYSGTWHRGESGRECQRWDSQMPHKHKYNESWMFPMDVSTPDKRHVNFNNLRMKLRGDSSVTAVQNYCRDPDSDGFLWCYTMDPNSRWEKCGNPFC